MNPTTVVAPATPKKTRPQPSRKRSAAETTVRALQNTRAAWDEGVATYRVRIQGQFDMLQKALQGGTVRPKDVERIRALVKITLKPHRGRAKDLKRVEEALGKALERVPQD